MWRRRVGGGGGEEEEDMGGGGGKGKLVTASTNLILGLFLDIACLFIVWQVSTCALRL